MIRLLLGACILLSVGACAQPPPPVPIVNQGPSEVEIVKEKAERDYAANRISFGQLVKRVADAFMRESPNDAGMIEILTYSVVLGEQVDAGKISKAEYRSMLAAKASQVRERHAALRIEAAKAILSTRSTVQTTDCYRTFGGGMNCTSY